MAQMSETSDDFMPRVTLAAMRSYIETHAPTSKAMYKR